MFHLGAQPDLNSALRQFMFQALAQDFGIECVFRNLVHSLNQPWIEQGSMVRPGRFPWCSYNVAEPLELARGHLGIHPGDAVELCEV